jgi:hypothetical protein
MADDYTYRNLMMWDRAQQLALEVMKIVQRLPDTWSNAVIARQIVASATSIGANIAEGHARYTPGAHRNCRLRKDRLPKPTAGSICCAAPGIFQLQKKPDCIRNAGRLWQCLRARSKNWKILRHHARQLPMRNGRHISPTIPDHRRRSRSHPKITNRAVRNERQTLSTLISWFSVLSSRFSVLSSRFSVLSSQFSVLSSRFLVLNQRRNQRYGGSCTHLRYHPARW